MPQTFETCPDSRSAKSRPKRSGCFDIGSESCVLAEESVSNIFILMLKWSYAYASFLSVARADGTAGVITDLATSWLRMRLSRGRIAGSVVFCYQGCAC
jgi:hypothetical protein